MIVITPKGNFGIYKSVEVIDSGLRCDDSILPFTVIGNDYTISQDDSLIPPVPAPAPIVPQVVTMRQARLALLQEGKLATVNAAIAGMVGTQGDAARIEWEFSSEVKRSQPLVMALAPALSMTSGDLDSLFILAAGL